jgi:hypothetical protein
MFLASRSGDDENVGATSNRRDEYGVVEGERAIKNAASDLVTIGHLAQGRADLFGYCFHCGKNGDVRLDDAKGMRELNCVLDDVVLFRERRIDVDSSVGNEQGTRVSGASMTKTWLIRRAVRSLFSSTTAPMNSSPWRLPFITHPP